MSTTLDEAFARAANGCQVPDCDHAHDGPMYVHSRCHPSADVAVALDPATRTILVECRECRAPVASIACPRPSSFGSALRAVARSTLGRWMGTPRDSRVVSAELATALKRIHALEAAIQANRGDWLPPGDARVWTERELAELRELAIRIKRADDPRWGSSLFARTALNMLRYLAALCDEYETEGHMLKYTLRARSAPRESAPSARETP